MCDKGPIWIKLDIPGVNLQENFFKVKNVFELQILYCIQQAVAGG